MLTSLHETPPKPTILLNFNIGSGFKLYKSEKLNL